MKLWTLYGPVPTHFRAPLRSYPTGTMPLKYWPSWSGMVESGCFSTIRTVLASIFVSLFGSMEASPAAPKSPSFGFRMRLIE